MAGGVRGGYLPDRRAFVTGAAQSGTAPSAAGAKVRVAEPGSHSFTERQIGSIAGFFASILLRPQPFPDGLPQRHVRIMRRQYQMKRIRRSGFGAQTQPSGLRRQADQVD